MSRSETESRSIRAHGDLNGGRAEPFRVLRLYTLEKKDPRKPGPPRKILQLALEHLPPEVASLLREQIEAQLRPLQALEIDGQIVARGPEVGSDDIEASIELRGDLGETYSFAHRMLWEVYERETAAIDRLSERSAEMFRRNLESMTQLQRAIQETLELQAGLAAILESIKAKEGSKGVKEAPAGEGKGEGEEFFTAKTLKDVVQGLSNLKDLAAEVAKISKDLKDLKGGPAAGSPAPA